MKSKMSTPKQSEARRMLLFSLSGAIGNVLFYFMYELLFAGLETYIQSSRRYACTNAYCIVTFELYSSNVDSFSLTICPSSIFHLFELAQISVLAE